MKFTSIFILFICLLAATFSNWLIITLFSVNQQYIAKELCVNRNNPNSTCNGHCYLRKQLNKAEKPEGTNGSSSKEKFEVQLFFAGTPQNNLVLDNCSKIFCPYIHPFSEQFFMKDCFRPPCA